MSECVGVRGAEKKEIGGVDEKKGVKEGKKELNGAGKEKR